ncbi:MAG: carbamoyltransferase HypF, partial [Planctomycetales bacterium]|nr:carbamoyltransferase HypF [Planctomycetales bacterium]
HPSYLSSDWAAEFAERLGCALVKVQHHHAHVAAVLAEHRIDPAQPVIGVSFDGTGYGTDGAIWGGEFLLASCRSFSRLAHLKYVPMPGADAAARNPWRMALAHLKAAGIAWDERLPCVADASAAARTALLHQMETSLNCAPTSSVGRLFDAVAALIGVRQETTYEAQAALEMESLAGDACHAAPYAFALHDGAPLEIDAAPMLAAICQDVLQGAPRSAIVDRFHSTVAQFIVDVCRQAGAQTGISQVALSGGVFQNGALLGCTTQRLKSAGFTVLTHQAVPPNDGGLALGQAIIAAESLAAPTS